MRQTKKPVEIERTDRGYNVRFYTPGIDLESYRSIESVVKDVVQNNLKLAIDLTQVQYANGDFFNYLVAEYLRARPRGKRLEAIKTMQDNLTLIVNQASRVYETSYQGRPGLFKYELRRNAA